MNIKIKIFLFFLFCEIYDFRRRNYEAGEIIHILRTTNMTACPDFYEKPLDFNLTSNRFGTRQMLVIDAFNHVDFNMTKAIIKLHRCLGYEYACENFQTWNISPVCPFVRMKNQIWSPIFDSMKPASWRRSCPLTKKGKYSFINSTLDMNEMLKFYGEGAKYYWNLQLELYDQNVMVHCIFGTFHVTPYTKKISAGDDKLE